MSIPSKSELAARATTPYRVVSDTSGNMLRRDLQTLDKQQSYLLKGLDREQKAFRRSLDSLQSTRVRSGGGGGRGHLNVPGVNGQGLGLSVSPSLNQSRHLANCSSTHDPAAHRSVSAASSQYAQQPHTRSPATMARNPRGSPKVLRKSRTIGSPSTSHRSYVNAFPSPLADSASKSVAKSWTPNGAWSKPPTGLHVPTDRERAASSGDIRNAYIDDLHVQPMAGGNTDSNTGIAASRSTGNRHSLPPLVVHPSKDNHHVSIAQASHLASRSNNGLASAAGQYGSQEFRHSAARQPKTSDPLGLSEFSVHGETLTDGPYAGGGTGRNAGEVPLTQANVFLASNQVRLVQSHNLLEDLTSSLPRITRSRPGTAVQPAGQPASTSSGGQAGKDAAAATAEPANGHAGLLAEDDGELLSNGFPDDGVMGDNAHGGKSLARLMSEIKGCRYIRHYTSGSGPGSQDHEDAARKIFAD
eukprot:scpid39002/ scgid33869/ 